MLLPPTGQALPVVKTLADSADYARTFSEFLPQLYELPSAVLSRISSPAALAELYLSTNPAISGLALAIFTIPFFLGVSEINKNYSQVDRLWSILPTVFIAHLSLWAHVTGFPAQRIDHVLGFGFVWSVRLTFNYWRRGGYQVGSEDYRWEIIKEKIGGAAFAVLNVTFISSVQPILLWAVTTPAYVLLLVSRLEPTVNTIDLTFGRGLIVLIAVEFLADQQQWNYHKAKHSFQKTNKVPQGWTRAQLERGFNTTGLFKFSRHPNLLCEQLIWFTLYVWALVKSGTSYNWTGFGTLAYLSIFWASTPLTEFISSGKYPQYKTYKKKAGMFLPNPFARGWSEDEVAKTSKKSK